MKPNQLRKEIHRRGGRVVVAKLLGIHPAQLTRRVQLIKTSLHREEHVAEVLALPVTGEQTSKQRMEVRRAAMGAVGRWGKAK